MASDLNPLYSLHHSDHPGMVLVSKPLHGDNYSTWSRAMVISLNEKSKIGFVDGTLGAPSMTTQPKDYATWKRCNDMVLSWLLNSLTPDIADSVIFCSTAHEVWEDFRSRFSQSNAPRIFQIERDIACLAQEQMSVALYYTKLKKLWDELGSYIEAVCTCEGNSRRRKLMQFLMGLNESYHAIRGQILLMNPLPDAVQTYSLIIEEEKQRNLSTTRVAEASAMLVQNDEHVALSVRQKPGSSNRRPLHCSYCNRDNHVREKCWKLHGYPPGYSKNASSKRDTNPSVGHVKEENPMLKQFQSAANNLTDLQLQQMLSIMQGNGLSRPTTPKANNVHYA